LLDELNFKDDVIIDVLFLCSLAGPDILIQVNVDTLIILEFSLSQYLIAGEFIKCGKNVSHAQNCPIQLDKIFLGFLPNDGFSYRILGLESVYEIYVTRMMLPILFVAIVVLFIGLQQDNAASFSVTKKGDSFIRFLFEVAEAHDIPECLYRVQDPIRTRKCL